MPAEFSTRHHNRQTDRRGWVGRIAGRSERRERVRVRVRARACARPRHTVRGGWREPERMLASLARQPPFGPVLTHLAVRDFTIIHRLDVELGAGLTALTGETGAGKSILVDALGFALGGRASGAMVRPGAERAEVVATFDADRRPELADLRERLEIDAADGNEDGDAVEWVLRRRIAPDGRSRAWINDSSVSNRTLRELGSQLVDLQGQHSHHALLRPAHQLRVLDVAAEHADLVSRTGDEYGRLAKIEEALETARSLDGAERERRIDFLRFQSADLDALGAKPGESTELGAELRRLAHAIEIRSGAEAIEEALAGGEHAADSAMHRALGRLDDIERRVPGLTKDARELLETALVHVSEASAAVRALARGIDTDPARLAAIEDRLAALHDAGRKHRVAPDELPNRLDALRAELDGLESGEAKVRALEHEREAARAAYREAAERLSESRARTADRLAGEVTRRIRELGLEHGEFSVDIRRSREDRSSGRDEVSFLVRANPGHPPVPFARSASGGEQSRISLGILVASRGGLPVMVFDEIDSGVGGRVAELVGRHLRRLAEHRQVLCVTHLPQVASQAQGHLTVSKGVNGAMTSVRVRTVAGEARAEEIARMLAGASVTARSIAHAREMLESAGRQEVGSA